MVVCIYIERERDIHTHVYIYIYIYTYPAWRLPGAGRPHDLGSPGHRRHRQENSAEDCSAGGSRGRAVEEASNDTQEEFEGQQWSDKREFRDSDTLMTSSGKLLWIMIWSDRRGSQGPGGATTDSRSVCECTRAPSGVDRSPSRFSPTSTPFLAEPS